MLLSSEKVETQPMLPARSGLAPGPKQRLFQDFFKTLNGSKKKIKGARNCRNEELRIWDLGPKGLEKRTIFSENGKRIEEGVWMKGSI